jgi:hypothetical protein
MKKSDRFFVLVLVLLVAVTFYFHEKRVQMRYQEQYVISQSISISH